MASTRYLRLGVHYQNSEHVDDVESAFNTACTDNGYTFIIKGGDYPDHTYDYSGDFSNLRYVLTATAMELVTCRAQEFIGSTVTREVSETPF